MILYLLLVDRPSKPRSNPTNLASRQARATRLLSCAVSIVVIMELVVAFPGGVVNRVHASCTARFSTTREEFLREVLPDCRNWWLLRVLFGPYVQSDNPLSRWPGPSVPQVMDTMDDCVLENNGLEFYWSHL